MDGVGVGDLFRRRHRHVPGGENFAPIDFFCGPNFHNDFPGTDSVFVNQGTFQTGAANGTIRVVLSPVGGAGNSGVGRFKVFSVRLLHERDVGHTEWADAPQWKRKRHCQQRWLRAGIDVAVATTPTSHRRRHFQQHWDGHTCATAHLWNDGARPVGGQHGSRARRTGALHDQHNRAVQGGGILNSGQLQILNSTVVTICWSRGGGIQNTGITNISFSTITRNIANTRLEAFNEAAVGGGIRNASTGINMANTIVAGNMDNRSVGLPLQSPDCYSTVMFRFTSHRDNLVGVLSDNCLLTDTIFGNTAFDSVGTPAAPLNAMLGALANNGGPTLTHALLAGPGHRQGYGRDQRDAVRLSRHRPARFAETRRHPGTLT